MQKEFNQESFIQKIKALQLPLPYEFNKILNLYNQYLIPFERSLRNNALQYNPKYNQREKIELLTKIEQIQRQLDFNTSELKRQREKLEIVQLENKQNRQLILSLKKLNQNLQVNVYNLQASVQQKIKAIKNFQQEKITLVKQIEEKTNEYNQLLMIFMNEKNIQADRINSMNEMQERIIERERKLEEDKFYLETQMKKFEKEKKSLLEEIKNLKQGKNSNQKNDPSRKNPNNLKPFFQEQRDQAIKNNGKSQLARNPIKKIIKLHSSEIYSLTTNYNGNLIASCGGDRYIKFYDPLNLKPLTTIQSNSAQSIFLSLHMNYAGDRIVTGSTDKNVYIYHSNLGKLLNGLVGHGQKVNAVAFTNSKQKCVSGSDDRQIKFWDLEKGSNILSVLCGKSVKVITPNYSEPIIYSGHGDGSIRVYSTTQGANPLNQIKGLIDYPITSIALASSKNQILVGSKEGSSLSIFDLRINKIFKKYEDKDFFNSGEHFNADYSPNQQHIVAGTYDGSILYWNVDTGKRELKLAGHDGSVTSVKYHPFTSILTSSDSKGNMILWN